MDLENQYYNSKAQKEEDPNGALNSFQRVLELENNEKGEWGFKALKQMIKINFKLVIYLWNYNIQYMIYEQRFIFKMLHFQSNYPEMMNRYKQLLTYIKTAVTRNHSEKSINSILDYISTSKNVCVKYTFVHNFDWILKIISILFLLLDGTTAELLWNYSGCLERCEKWQIVV